MLHRPDLNEFHLEFHEFTATSSQLIDVIFAVHDYLQRTYPKEAAMLGEKQYKEREGYKAATAFHFAKCYGNQ